MKALYTEFQRFKNRGDFKVYGLRVDGPYGDWSARVEALRSAPGMDDFFEEYGVSDRTLLMLAFDYISDGRDTSGWREKALNDALNR